MWKYSIGLIKNKQQQQQQQKTINFVSLPNIAWALGKMAGTKINWKQSLCSMYFIEGK